MCGTAIHMVLGVSWCLHSCHGPFQERWAHQLCPASICRVSADEIGAHAFGISRCSCFLSQVSNLCWKGALCFNLAKTSCFTLVLLLLQQSPSFSWDFKVPRVCPDSLCRFPAAPCSKAPAWPSSPAVTVARGSCLGATELCSRALLSLRGSCGTAMGPWPCVVAAPSCRCCAQTPLPQQGHLTSALWAAVAEAAGSALLVINRDKGALCGAMHLTPIRYVLLHRVNYTLRAPIDYRSSPGCLVQTQTCEMNPTAGAWCQYLSV